MQKFQHRRIRNSIIFPPTGKPYRKTITCNPSPTPRKLPGLGIGLLTKIGNHRKASVRTPWGLPSGVRAWATHSKGDVMMRGSPLSSQTDPIHKPAMLFWCPVGDHSVETHTTHWGGGGGVGCKASVYLIKRPMLSGTWGEPLNCSQFGHFWSQLDIEKIMPIAPGHWED